MKNKSLSLEQIKDAAIALLNAIEANYEYISNYPCLVEPRAVPTGDFIRQQAIADEMEELQQALGMKWNQKERRYEFPKTKKK